MLCSCINWYETCCGYLYKKCADYLTLNYKVRILFFIFLLNANLIFLYSDINKLK